MISTSSSSYWPLLIIRLPVLYSAKALSISECRLFTHTCPALQVNGRRLLGLNHMEVVNTLKELPVHVRMVCARRSGHPPLHAFDGPAQARSQFAARVSERNAGVRGRMGGGGRRYGELCCICSPVFFYSLA